MTNESPLSEFDRRLNDEIHSIELAVLKDKAEKADPLFVPMGVEQHWELGTNFFSASLNQVQCNRASIL